MRNCDAHRVVVRTMTYTDIAQILRNFDERGWHKPKEVLEKYLDGQNQGSLWVFIAECHGDIAGYTVVYPDTTVGPFAHENLPVISDFIVFEKYQHHGIGTMILETAERKAAELSDRVQLGVGLHSGYGTAQKMYVKRGYVPDGSGVWYKDSLLEPYADCCNDDDLVLYLVKDLRA